LKKKPNGPRPDSFFGLSRSAASAGWLDSYIAP
jgi:hypothetical protein